MQGSHSRPRLERRLGVDAENADLLDRLRRPRSAITLRAIRGDEDERRTRVVRFDGRWQQLRFDDLPRLLSVCPEAGEAPG